MTKLKQLWLLTAVGSIAALVAGYFLLVSPKNSKAEALRNDAQTQEDLNESLRAQIQMLNRQKKDLPRQQAELEKFAAKIPNNPALPALVRALSDAADSAGIDLVSMAPSPPTAVTPAAPVGGTAAAAPATAAGAPAVQQLPLAAIPITIQISGSYSGISQFFSEVERLPRAFLVKNFSVTPVSDGAAAAGAGAGGAPTMKGPLQVSLTGQLYMTIKAPTAPRAPQPAATTVVK